MLYISNIYYKPLEKRKYILTKSLKAITNNCRMYIVPKAFITDFATIPWPLTYIYPPDKKEYRRAATIHDFLLKEMYSGNLHTMTRKEASNIFRRALQYDEVDKITIQIFYVGVRSRDIYKATGKYLENKYAEFFGIK